MKSSQKVVVLHVWMASMIRQEISSLVFVCFGSATLLTVTFAVRLTPVSLCVCVNMLIPHCLRRKGGQSLDLTLTKQHLIGCWGGARSCQAVVCLRRSWQRGSSYFWAYVRLRERSKTRKGGDFPEEWEQKGFPALIGTMYVQLAKMN